MNKQPPFTAGIQVAEMVYAPRVDQMILLVRGQLNGF